MEHACAKCGASVEDGVAFCPQCRAPQIRVVTVEPPPGEAAVSPLPPPTSVFSPTRAHPAPVFWTRAVPAAAVGGMIGLLGTFIPFGALGPAYALGGAVAVFMYRARTHIVPSPRAGAKIGAASGAVAFLIFAVIVLATYFRDPDPLRKVFAQVIAQLSARGSDPQVIQQLNDLLNAPGGLGSLTLYLLVVLLVIFLIGFSIGGALCAAYLRRGR